MAWGLFAIWGGLIVALDHLSLHYLGTRVVGVVVTAAGVVLIVLAARGRTSAMKALINRTAESDRPRGLLFEIAGATSSMLIGAFIGSLANGNGPGYVSFIVLCSILGSVLWYRRNQAGLGNAALCVLAIILWWPIGLAIRDAFR